MTSGSNVPLAARRSKLMKVSSCSLHDRRFFEGRFRRSIFRRNLFVGLFLLYCKLFFQRSRACPQIIRELLIIREVYSDISSILPL